MSASLTDKITDVRNGARPNSARVVTSRIIGGTNLACNDLSGWPTASKVHFVTYQIDTNSNPVLGSQLDCYGIVSGNTITQIVVVDGVDGGSSVGDVVEMLPTAAWGQDLADALTRDHNRDGSHQAGITLTTPVITTPTIADFTNANHTHASAGQGGQLGASAFPANTFTKATTIYDDVAASAQSFNTSFADVTNWSTGSLLTTGGDVIFFLELSYYRNSAGQNSAFVLVVDSTLYPKTTGVKHYTNELGSHKSVSRTILVSGLSAGTHTVKIQVRSDDGSGTANVDLNDYCRLTALEIKR